MDPQQNSNFRMLAVGLAAFVFAVSCLALAAQTITGLVAAILVTGCLMALLMNGTRPDTPVIVRVQDKTQNSEYLQRGSYRGGL